MSLSVSRVRLYLLKAPIDVPVRTSFAVMTHRPAVLVAVEDADGAVGWGEIWCNHPPMSGPARMALAEEVVAPWVIGRPFADAGSVYGELTAAFRTLAIQTAEPGPYAQVIAGFEAALWDLAAHKAGKPLYQLLGGAAVGSVPAYASGINPNQTDEVIARARAEGHTRFKIKVGFDDDADLAVANGVAGGLQAGEGFMLDANQGWSPDHAQAILPKIAAHGPIWMEEPIHADAPMDAWQALKSAGAPPLAGGENMLTYDFSAAIESGAFAFIQPDVAKWGGISGCLDVARRTLSAGLTYCPHFLGAAPGLLASAHLLAAAGGDGLLEVDVNANPLRADLNTVPIRCADGDFLLPEGPGIAFEPDETVMNEFTVATAEVTAAP